MKFLDSTGLGVLWNKIKSTFLPLSGGTMTGGINYKSADKTVLCNIGTNGDINHNNGTGWIRCSTNDGTDLTISGGQIDIYGSKHLQISEDDIKIDDTSIIDEAITTEELNEVLV